MHVFLLCFFHLFLFLFFIPLHFPRAGWRQFYHLKHIIKLVFFFLLFICWLFLGKKCKEEWVGTSKTLRQHFIWYGFIILIVFFSFAVFKKNIPFFWDCFWHLIHVTFLFPFFFINISFFFFWCFVLGLGQETLKLMYGIKLVQGSSSTKQKLVVAFDMCILLCRFFFGVILFWNYHFLLLLFLASHHITWYSFSFKFFCYLLMFCKFFCVGPKNFKIGVWGKVSSRQFKHKNKSLQQHLTCASYFNYSIFVVVFLKKIDPLFLDCLLASHTSYMV